MGRFVSADSIIPGGMQGYDRYAYAANNPVRNTDPTGRKCVGDPEECKNEDGRAMNGAGDPSNSTAWVNPVNPMAVGGGWHYYGTHIGIDLNIDGDENGTTPIVASSYGTVYSSSACVAPCQGHNPGDNGGYGNAVIIGYSYDSLPKNVQELIPEGATLFLMYGHLAQPSELQTGDTVAPGDLVGFIGNTGNSDGAHLHLEVRIERPGYTLPVGDLHRPYGKGYDYTTTYYGWSNHMTYLNPNLFFSIVQ